MTQFNSVPIMVDIQTERDHRGALGIIETQNLVGFETKRLYFLYNIADKQERGHHAHKKLEQFIFAAHGSFDIELKGQNESYNFTLSAPDQGLYIPPKFWRDLKNFSSDAVCVVACSELYDDADYIRNYDDFLAWELHS